MARSGELAIEGDGRLYAPAKRGESWDLDQLLYDDEFAEMLRVPLQEAHEVAVTIGDVRMW